MHEALDSIGTSRGTEKQDRNPHEGELQSESCKIKGKTPSTAQGSKKRKGRICDESIGEENVKQQQSLLSLLTTSTFIGSYKTSFRFFIF